MSRGLDLKQGLEGKAEKQSTKLLGGVGCLEKSMRKTGRKAMLRYPSEAGGQGAAWVLL